MRVSAGVGLRYVDVLTLLSHDIANNFVINACMIKLVLHIVQKTVEGELLSIRAKLLINDLTHSAAHLAAENIISGFITLREEAISIVPLCSQNMIQKAEINQVGVETF
jgi:hypothetical protein